MPEKILDVQQDWVPLWRAPFVFAREELKQAFEQWFTNDVILDQDTGSVRIGERLVRLANFGRDPHFSLTGFAQHEMKLGAVWSYGIAAISRQVASHDLQVWARVGHVAAPFEKIAPDTWLAIVNDWVDEIECTAQVPDGPGLFSIYVAAASTPAALRISKKQRTQAAIIAAVTEEWPDGIPEGLQVQVRDDRINERLKKQGTLLSASPPTIPAALKTLTERKKG